ncbi:hypothetical protein [Georgenia wangjunii]|uniref:hypothetical protein n=1 Tax=Georgenia wangjunii TaxID=3117730 RepID=UPI002F26B0C6
MGTGGAGWGTGGSTAGAAARGVARRAVGLGVDGDVAERRPEDERAPGAAGEGLT